MLAGDEQAAGKWLMDQAIRISFDGTVLGFNKTVDEILAIRDDDLFVRSVARYFVKKSRPDKEFFLLFLTVCQRTVAGEGEIRPTLATMYRVFGLTPGNSGRGSVIAVSSPNHLMKLVVENCAKVWPSKEELLRVLDQGLWMSVRYGVK